MVFYTNDVYIIFRKNLATYIKNWPREIYDLVCLALKTTPTNNPIQKMDRRSKQTFLQRRHADGYKAHEKTFNITNY